MPRRADEGVPEARRGGATPASSRWTSEACSTRVGTAVKRPLLLVIVCFAIGGEAHAFVDLDGEYWLAGSNFGYVTDGDRHDALFGVEASFVEIDDNLAEWAGVYADTLYDTRGVVRSSIGLEAGSYVTGIDLGPVLEVGADDVSGGLRFRFVVSIAVASIYLRGRHADAVRVGAADARDRLAPEARSPALEDRLACVSAAAPHDTWIGRFSTRESDRSVPIRALGGSLLTAPRPSRGRANRVPPAQIRMWRGLPTFQLYVVCVMRSHQPDMVDKASK